MGRIKKEDSIIASFEFGKYTYTYDGNCWTTITDDVTKAAYHSTFEGVLNALLNKTVSNKVEDLKSVIYEIRKAKQELLDAIKYIKFNQEEE